MSIEPQSTPRDTQFAGFARMLIKEIDDAIGEAAKRAEETEELNEAELEQRLRTIIAQRAYDFALFILEDVGSLYVSRMGSREELLEYLKNKLADISDMSQFPEEAT